MNELEIGKSFLNATTGHISQYSGWCSLYGDKKFSNKELGKKIKAVRKAFFHDGTKEDIENFWAKHEDLKNFLYNNK